MTVTTREVRPNSSTGASGGIETIDGIEYPGLGSAGFGEDDLLIIGSGGDDSDLIGGTGHDEIEGEDGDDSISGGSGSDKLEGDSGDDDLDGQDGNDGLIGGTGNDILRAGHGHDILYGDSDAPTANGSYDGSVGHDTFGFYAIGHFHVMDFSLNVDRLFFDASQLGVDNLEDLLDYVTHVDNRGDAGFTVEFVGGAATIELVGVNINAITSDMIVFTL